MTSFHKVLTSSQSLCLRSLASIFQLCACCRVGLKILAELVEKDEIRGFESDKTFDRLTGSQPQALQCTLLLSAPDKALEALQ